MKKMSLLVFLPILLIIFFLFFYFSSKNKTVVQNKIITQPIKENSTLLYSSMFIDTLRQRKYQESNIKIEETLAPGVNYKRYIGSYKSDGFKIYGLFTIPNNNKPERGFPAIVFLHGYLPPKEYITTERYVVYQDAFAKNGFITFKPDLRGHGKSEGEAVNSNFSPDYVIDTLNLVVAFKSYKSIDPQRIGMWGHSNGGNLTLRSMVISKDIKAGVVWAGVVGNYEDLLNRYRKKIPWLNANRENEITPSSSNQSLQNLIDKYGSPSASSSFWSKIDPYYYLNDISGSIQIHHGTADISVPIELSQHLFTALKRTGKLVEYYEYANGDHNIAEPAFSIAIKRSIEFFKKYL